MRPGKDLHQRALAGPVLADQGTDFARVDPERDAVERPRGPERLGDVSHFQEHGSLESATGHGRSTSMPAPSRARNIPNVLDSLAQKIPSTCPR